MNRISDALELLTAQHEQIEELLDQVRRTSDAKAFAALADQLTTHLALEQELFYPAIATQVSPDVMREMLAEHLAIKQVLAELVWLGTEDMDFGQKLARLSMLLVGHSAWQEDQLFMTAAESMSRDELATLCDRFHAFDTAIAFAA